MDNICYDGVFLKKDTFNLSFNNRGFRYGDSFFETIKCNMGKPLFWEEHYFRIAASFCILKMNPPSIFQMEKLSYLIEDLLIKNNLHKVSARVRIYFFRHDGGYYSPSTLDVSYIIESGEVLDLMYKPQLGLKMGLYRENLISKNQLSNLKSTSRLINILASIYGKDNNYDDCFLINEDKNIVESISGNIFIVLNDNIITPCLENGCIDGVMRKIILQEKKLNIEEKNISLFELFNAEEVFVTNVIIGVRSVAKIKNHTYNNKTALKIINLLNENYLV